MMAFVLNLPYTLVGLLIGVISLPRGIRFNKKPYAFVIRVKKFWWVYGYLKHARAMTIGHVILLGPHLEKKDLKHELIHVEKYTRKPFIHPFLYYKELLHKGLRKNKYENEAYSRAGDVYVNYKNK